VAKTIDMFLYPPRPKNAIAKSELEYYEKVRDDKGNPVWIAQPKYNGSRNLVHITEDRHVKVWSRHGSPHLTYSLPNSVADELLALPGLEKGKEYWLDSELMSKTAAPETKNLIVFFDVLQAGRYMFGRPDQMKRLEILADICGRPIQLDPWRQMGYVISKTLLMAPFFEKDFGTEFERNRGDEVEGLLLRRKDFAIDSFGQSYWETGSLLRCRKPHKNYNH
jgi:hypothetical protein